MHFVQQLHILKVGSTTPLAKLTEVKPGTRIGDIKNEIYRQRKSLYVERQSLRSEPKGKSLGDDRQIESIELGKVDGVDVLYFKDLGPQIGWSTVFLCEYAGPIFAYLITYFQPFRSIIYGLMSVKATNAPVAPVVHIAAICWTVHYIKRILETIFVHRFSHSTMPIFNLFKNCSYYWGFAFYVGYFVNHPLYTAPYFGCTQVYGALAVFILSELGNLSIHLALRDLRPAGSKERKIPYPTSNPFTYLFKYVSCPNYSYEVYSWAAFTIMTQTLPAGMFTAAGFFQMALWALGKHRNYKKEFPNYPKGRKAIIPFLI